MVKEDFKECDFYYGIWINEGKKEPYYENLERLEIAKKEIRLREIWENLKIPELGNIPKKLIWSEKSSSHIISFKSPIEDYGQLITCLERFIQEAGFPKWIYGNKVINGNEFITPEIISILGNHKKELGNFVDKLFLEDWAKKRIPRVVY